jgi:hypothetical protein
MSSLENKAGSLEGRLERSSNLVLDREGRAGFWNGEFDLRLLGIAGERCRILGGGGRGISSSMVNGVSDHLVEGLID